MTTIEAAPDVPATDAELLLQVLNSAPVVDGAARDALRGEEGAAFAAALGGTGSEAELAALRVARGAVWRLVRHEPVTQSELDALLAGVHLRPHVTADGVAWRLDGARDALLPARVILAWSQVGERHPGRLRACANAECNLFLLDRSRPGTARWCSMSTCGNRMKARAHAARSR